MDTNWLHFLAFVNTAATNMDLQMEFSGYIHRGGIARSYDSSIFNLLKSLQTDFHTVLTFTTPAVNRASSFPDSLQHLLSDTLMIDLDEVISNTSFNLSFPHK